MENKSFTELGTEIDKEIEHVRNFLSENLGANSSGHITWLDAVSSKAASDFQEFENTINHIKNDAIRLVRTEYVKDNFPLVSRLCWKNINFFLPIIDTQRIKFYSKCEAKYASEINAIAEFERELLRKIRILDMPESICNITDISEKDRVLPNFNAKTDELKLIYTIVAYEIYSNFNEDSLLDAVETWRSDLIEAGFKAEAISIGSIQTRIELLAYIKEHRLASMLRITEANLGSLIDIVNLKKHLLYELASIDLNKNSLFKMRLVNSTKYKGMSLELAVTLAIFKQLISNLTVESND